MTLQGEYLGMQLLLGDEDPENKEFFEWCGRHELRLQRWKSNGLLSYPPGTGSPWDGTAEFEWSPVSGLGTVMSYSEVHHAIMPMFGDHLPYLLLRVELDEQRGQPTEHEAIRVLGNLVTPDGELAPPGAHPTGWDRNPRPGRLRRRRRRLRHPPMDRRRERRPTHPLALRRRPRSRPLTPLTPTPAPTS